MTDFLAGTKQTIERMKVRPGLVVAEVGPGPGRLLVPIAKIVGASGQAIGIDVQKGMLDRLARKVDEQKLSNVRLILGDATKAHLPPETADLVFLCTVLGEIPDRAAAIRQCRELLKANGTLSITEIALDPHFQTQSAVKRIVEKEGFEHVETLGRPWFYTMNFCKRPGTFDPRSSNTKDPSSAA